MRTDSFKICLSRVLSLIFGVLLVGSLIGCGSESAEGTDGRRVFVGTGSGDAEAGIYTFRFDETSGALTETGDVTPILNPTYVALTSDGEYLYSVSETTDSAAVQAFAVESPAGTLRRLSTVSAEGGAPCYISLDQTGQWVFTANYVGGNVAVFPVQGDGSLGAASQVVPHTGSGADPDRQRGPHPHFIRVDPQNEYLLTADLGIDQVRIYPFDAERGRLDTTSVRSVSTPAGTGPRHLAFHPSGEYVYLVGELSGTVTVYEYDADEGRMTSVQTVSTVPDEFEEAARSADIHVHPSGRFLYVSNRGDANDLVHYTIDEANGTLTVAGRQADGVQWPRNFALDPSGQYLMVANRRDDSVVVFRIDQETGALRPTDHSVQVPEPTKIEFAAQAG